MALADYFPIFRIARPDGTVADIGSGSSVATTDTSGTLAAGANAQPLAANPARQFLAISNTGGAAMTARFGAAASATVGHPIAAGGTAVFDAKCPTGALNLFSASGTTYTVTSA